MKQDLAWAVLLRSQGDCFCCSCLAIQCLDVILLLKTKLKCIWMEILGMEETNGSQQFFLTSVLLVLSVWPEVASSFSACVSSVFVLSQVQRNIIVLIRCTPHSASLREGCGCLHLCQALSFHRQTQLAGCSDLTSCPLSLLSPHASLSSAS